MMHPEPLLLDVAAASRLLGVSERTAWSLIAGGQLRSVKIGRRRLVPRHALETFVDGLEGAPDAKSNIGSDVDHRKRLADG